MASGVAPTAAGHALARRMLPVLAEFEAAVLETRRFARGQNSQIRVGYMRAVKKFTVFYTLNFGDRSLNRKNKELRHSGD